MSTLLQRQLTFDDVLPLVAAVEVRDRSIQLVLRSLAVTEPHEPMEAILDRLRPRVLPHRLIVDGDHLHLIIDRSPIFHGGKASGCHAPREPISREGQVLLRSAHRLLQRHSMSPADTAAHVHATAPGGQRQRRIMVLGLLVPKLQKALLQGTFSGRLFRDGAPLAWVDQMNLANATGAFGLRKGMG